jgi:hypothetical protein
MAEIHESLYRVKAINMKVVNYAAEAKFHTKHVDTAKTEAKKLYTDNKRH